MKKEIPNYDVLKDRNPRNKGTRVGDHVQCRYREAEHRCLEEDCCWVINFQGSEFLRSMFELE